IFFTGVSPMSWLLRGIGLTVMFALLFPLDASGDGSSAAGSSFLSGGKSSPKPPVPKPAPVPHHVIHGQPAVHAQVRNQNVEFVLNDDTKVRTSSPPVEYDDNGKPKKYTPEELKKLKGPDSKLPGYTGDINNLAKDQIVTLYLAKVKDDTKS